MDNLTPYFIARSTLQDPRKYGARLTKCDEYRDDRPKTYETMLLIDENDEHAIWKQACDVVLKAFGAEGCHALSGTRCLYALEHNAWSDKHPRHKEDLAVCYRLPAWQPEEDQWEMMTMENIVVVTHEGAVYYVASLENEAAYLIIPEEVAHDKLRSAAGPPVEEEVESEVPRTYTFTPRVFTATGELSDKPYGEAVKELLGATDQPAQEAPARGKKRTCRQQGDQGTMQRIIQRRLCTAYQHATESAAALEQQNFTRQQADQIIATVERHAASHRDVAEAVHKLTQAMQTAVKEGVSEGKQHVNTVARYTVGACAAGVTITRLDKFSLENTLPATKG